MDPDKEHRVVNAKDNDNVVTDNIVNANPSALTNPVILDKIFGYLTVDEVKASRTVCKIWESVGTACLGRRCSLSIHNFFNYNAEIGFDSSPTIKDQLVRSVKIYYSNETQGEESEKYDFLAFVKKYQEQIEEIHFDVNLHFGPTIKWMLQNVTLSKLQKIDLHENNYCTERIAEDGWNYFDNLNFLPIPSMTTLKISAPCYMEGRDGDGGNRVDEMDGIPYYQIVQEIIKKSPNLERLEIGENFYPDLSCCKKLKVLKFEGHLFEPLPGEDSDSGEDSDDDDRQQFEIREDFSLSKMMKMLDQVKDTLEELVIGTFEEYIRRRMNKFEVPVLPDRTNVTLPCFPCLKSLLIYPIDMYTLELEKVTENQLPGLQKLTLQELNRRSGYLNRVLLTMKTCWRKVEHLSLIGLQCDGDGDDPTIIINKIVKAFPGTTKFQLWIKGELRRGPSPLIFQRFKDTLLEIATANWNIQHLEIGIEFCISLSKLMEAFGEVVSVEGFKQLKTLKLTSSHIRDEGCNNFEKPFLALRSITFDKIKFRASTLIKMAKFIERHDLSIHFLNAD